MMYLQVKDSEYVLDFKKGGNSIKRIADCSDGGNEVNIVIENPEDDLEEKIITGVELAMKPYIPDQNQGKSQEKFQVWIA